MVGSPDLDDGLGDDDDFLLGKRMLGRRVAIRWEGLMWKDLNG